MRMDTPTVLLGRVSAVLLAATAIGCNNVSTSVFVEGIAAPSDANMCVFDPGGPDFQLATVLNTAQLQDPVNPGRVNQQSLGLFARYRNVLASAAIEVEDNPAENFELPNRTTPIRFDFRWECDSNGFTAGQGPLFLPQFSVNQAFCLDNRNDTNEFVGFDQVSASGATAMPGGQGLIEFRPIPPQLGLAFDEVFQLATLSNACCELLGGCQNAANADLNSNNACRNLQQIFDAVGDGSLRATDVDALRRWQPFSIYDGTAAPTVTFAAYPMRLRGRFELITAGGSMVTSNELVHEVSVCRACGRITTPCTNF